jgi:hypothetical protein
LNGNGLQKIHQNKHASSKARRNAVKITRDRLRRIIREALKEKFACSECGVVEGNLDEAGKCSECAGGDQSKMGVLQQLPATLSPGRGPGGELDRTVRKLSYPISGRPNQKGFKF